MTAVAHPSPEVTVALPLDCVVSGPGFTWIVRTRYPAHGVVTVEYHGELETPCTLRLRVPETATAVQLVRGGAPVPVTPGADPAFVLLHGPWQPGDSVSLRFGIPFTVASEGSDGIGTRRFYPGAPPVENAVVRHGMRELAAWSPDGSLPDAATIGVRKDGVLVLRADEVPSPFAVPGDAFSTVDSASHILVARSIAGTLAPAATRQVIPRVEFGAFETSFDRGA